MTDPSKPATAPPDPVSPPPDVVEIDGDIGMQLRRRASDRLSLATYNHQQQQEIARRNIAYVLICLVTALVLMSFIYLWTLPLNENARKHVDNLMLLMQLVFGPIITLAATAIGYYFGTNSRTGGL